VIKRIGLHVVVLALLSQTALAAERPVLKTEQDRLSYAIGLEVARNFKKNDVQFDPNMVVNGMNDGLSGERPLLNEKEFRRIIGDFQNTVRQKMVANRQAQTFENRKRAAQFLDSNKSKEGVQVLASGIQYKVLNAGTGPRPGEADSVVFNFRGTLLDGTQFDGTEPGKPANVKLYDLFNGFKAVLTQMPVGSHWIAWIPPHLGYGERGVGNDVGPNELLVMDIELISTKPRE
jgi:FKBP-type peptidyl-prolyl cis-trans isomerase FklB